MGATTRRAHDTLTRDLTLDLWLETDGSLRLKDADELEASVVSERCSRQPADEALAARATTLPS